MLLVVLMILATSVPFDEWFARSECGVACFFGGSFSRWRSVRGMLPGICLHLPALFRCALLLYYHTVLRLPNGPHAARRSTV